MSSAWFSSDITFRIEDKQLNLGFIRSGNLVPQSELSQSPSSVFFFGFFCKLQVGCYVFCNQSAIKARSDKGYSDGCPYETLPHQDFRNSVHVTIGFLVTSITKAISPPSIAWLARQPTLVRVLVVSNLFHLRIMEPTVLLRTFSVADLPLVTILFCMASD